MIYMSNKVFKKIILTPEEIKERVRKVGEILQRYQQELHLFKITQRQLLESFAKQLERKKIEEIRKTIK